MHAGLCPACGIAYEKWQERRSSKDDCKDAADEESIGEVYDGSEQVDPLTFWGRVFIWCALAAWTFYFIRHGVDWEIIGGSFLHAVNLAFHEFGHVVFAPFGHFMMILGGSLFQVLLPLALLCVFLFYQRDRFGAAVMLWWCGQNFVDVAPYIRDAIYRSLPLVGGGGEESHDWGNLLTMLHVVDRAPRYGDISFTIGACLMCAALVWAVLILRQQYLALKN